MVPPPLPPPPLGVVTAEAVLDARQVLRAHYADVVMLTPLLPCALGSRLRGRGEAVAEGGLAVPATGPTVATTPASLSKPPSITRRPHANINVYLKLESAQTAGSSCIRGMQHRLHHAARATGIIVPCNAAGLCRGRAAAYAADRAGLDTTVVTADADVERGVREWGCGRVSCVHVDRDAPAAAGVEHGVHEIARVLQEESGGGAVVVDCTVDEGVDEIAGHASCGVELVEQMQATLAMLGAPTASAGGASPGTLSRGLVSRFGEGGTSGDSPFTRPPPLSPVGSEVLSVSDDAESSVLSHGSATPLLLSPPPPAPPRRSEHTGMRAGSGSILGALLPRRMRSGLMAAPPRDAAAAAADASVGSPVMGVGPRRSTLPQGLTRTPGGDREVTSPVTLRSPLTPLGPLPRVASGFDIAPADYRELQRLKRKLGQGGAEGVPAADAVPPAAVPRPAAPGDTREVLLGQLRKKLSRHGAAAFRRGSIAERDVAAAAADTPPADALTTSLAAGMGGGVIASNSTPGPIHEVYVCGGGTGAVAAGVAAGVKLHFRRVFGSAAGPPRVIVAVVGDDPPPTPAAQRHLDAHADAVVRVAPADIEAAAAYLRDNCGVLSDAEGAVAVAAAIQRYGGLAAATTAREGDHPHSTPKNIVCVVAGR